ncbi:MAG: hypothetical protein ACRDRA_08075 [Pseudonocardiaceae bacterium]
MAPQTSGFTSATGDRHTPRVAVLQVTSVRDGLEHQVSEHTMMIGNSGHYVALCGHRVLAAALACPPGRPCPNCVAIRRADASTKGLYRRPDQPGIWAQLATRLRGHAR